MANAAIRKLAKDLEALEAAIAPKWRVSVRIIYDDEPPTPGAIVLGFE